MNHSCFKLSAKTDNFLFKKQLNTLMEITLKQDYFDTKFTYLFYFGPGSLLGRGDSRSKDQIPERGGGIKGQGTKYLESGTDGGEVWLG